LAKLKVESKVLLVILAFLFIALQVVFFRENTAVVARLALALGWLFILPGYALLLFIHRTLSLAVRLGIGFCCAVAAYGLLSYYFGILGLHVRFHWLLIPLILLVLGASLSLIVEKKYKNEGK
jgi:hypothetical protein